MDTIDGNPMHVFKALSENVQKYEAGDYFVTAAIWRVDIQGGLYDTFEIGIRHKPTGTFHLLQNRTFNHQSVQEVANAIAMLLSDSTQSYDPEWCVDWFGRDKE